MVEEVIPDEVVEEVIPDEVVEEVIPDEVVEEVIPDEVIEEARKILEKVKNSEERKENVEPKKKDMGSQLDADHGRLNLRKHVIAKRRTYLAERKKYEKEYLARLTKKKKAKPKKSLNLKDDVDDGRLNLRKHVIAKRRTYLAERKKYEKEYLARLTKEKKAKPKKKKASAKKTRR